jgi:hypothetical protein
MDIKRAKSILSSDDVLRGVMERTGPNYVLCLHAVIARLIDGGGSIVEIEVDDILADIWGVQTNLLTRHTLRVGIADYLDSFQRDWEVVRREPAHLGYYQETVSPLLAVVGMRWRARAIDGEYRAPQRFTVIAGEWLRNPEGAAQAMTLEGVRAVGRLSSSEKPGRWARSYALTLFDRAVKGGGAIEPIERGEFWKACPSDAYFKAFDELMGVYPSQAAELDARAWALLEQIGWVQAGAAEAVAFNRRRRSREGWQDRFTAARIAVQPGPALRAALREARP